MRLVLCVAVAACVAALSALNAEARTFRCGELWSNATTENKPVDCFTNGEHQSKVLAGPEMAPLVFVAALPMIFFVIGFFLCPCVSLGRCCGCCGGSHRTPDSACCGDYELWKDMKPEEVEAQYARGSVRRTKTCTGILFFLTLVAMIIGVAGAAGMKSNYEDFFDQAKSVLTWVDGRSNKIRTLMTINATGELIPPLEENFFYDLNNVTNDFRGQIEDLKSTADEYASPMVIVSILVFAVSSLLMASLVLAACANIRTCLPCGCSVVFYLVFILFSVCGIVLLIFGLVLSGVCGERTQFLEDPTKPGLISFALVPQCNSTVPFEKIPDQVRTVIHEQSINSCQAMDQICSPSSSYNSSNPDEVYSCPTLTNATQDCHTFAEANAVASSMQLKPDNPVVRCVDNATGAIVTPCSLSRCGQMCNQTQTREASAQASTNLQYAANAELSFTQYVEPLLSCTVVYLEVLRPMEACDPMVSSLYLAGVGCLLMQILFLLGMCTIWRGQKRFFDSDYAAGGEKCVDGKRAPYEGATSFDEIHKPDSRDKYGDSTA